MTILKCKICGATKREPQPETPEDPKGKIVLGKKRKKEQ